MSSEIFAVLMQRLMKPSLFGIKLWILIALVLSLVTFVTITILFFYFTLCHRKKPYKSHFHWPKFDQKAQKTSSLDRRLLPFNVSESLMNAGKAVLSGQFSARTSASYRNDVESSSTRSSVMIKDAWRKEFSLLEINVATNEFAKENVIGIGDHGTVYHGVLFDGTRVAVKKLLLNSFQAEEFIAQVEELGHVRHKNLVNLLGYCMEGAHRMIVCEYVDNKSLHHWLHQCPEQLSPLTWSTRMNIIQGIARGLAYLHEGIEQGILHGSLKSSNILLDHQWNPRVSDFGIAKLFSPRWAFMLMEALGYIAPDHCVSPHTFTEKDDVYSFGILVMEIITGRTPIDRQQSQPYLVDWLKCMVACENTGNVVDPSLPEKPCSKELKRILLVALRCVDPDEEHRPNIGDVTHMLEPRDLLLGEDELQYLSSI